MYMVIKKMFTKFDTLVKIQMDQVKSLGLELKYGKYMTAVVVSDDWKQKLDRIAEEHSPRSLINKSGFIYLKTKVLSEKQKNEILDKGSMNNDVLMTCIGKFKNEKGESHLCWKILGMKKSEIQDEEVAPLDDF